MHELIEIKPQAAATTELEERRAYLEKKKELADQLGLNAQVSILNQDLKSLKSGMVSLPPMTEDEIAIWQAFLPNVYGTDYPNSTGTPIGRYRFDRVPMPVLEQWVYCKEHNLFNEYQIWTPERAVVDPILVGVCGENFHLIARWAESDNNLISFADIKRLLKRRWLFAWTPAPFIVLVATLVLGFIVTTAIHLPFFQFTTVIGSAISVIAAAIVFQSWRKDELMQAIRRCKS